MFVAVPLRGEGLAAVGVCGEGGGGATVQTRISRMATILKPILPSAVFWNKNPSSFCWKKLHHFQVPGGNLLTGNPSNSSVFVAQEFNLTGLISRAAFV